MIRKKGLRANYIIDTKFRVVFSSRCRFEPVEFQKIFRASRVGSCWPKRCGGEFPASSAQIELHSIIAIKFRSNLNRFWGQGGGVEFSGPPGAQSGWTRALLPVRTFWDGQKAP